MTDIVQKFQGLNVEMTVAGYLNVSPAEKVFHSVSPDSLTLQMPPTISIFSGAAVLNVRVEGKITPIDLRDPSSRKTVWLMHFPSK